MKDTVNPKKRRPRLTPTRVISLGFFGIILVGAFLLSLPFASKDGQWLNYGDALFTATSAVCVTGLGVVDTALHFTLFGQIIILLLIQIGGIGFMGGAMLLFFLVGKRITMSERMILKESFNHDSLQGVVRIGKNMLIFVGIAELIGIVVLSFRFIPLFGWGDGLFKSLFTSVSAFCNAGFDLFGTSGQPYVGLTGFVGDVLVCLPVMALVIVGGLGYVVMKDIGVMFKTKRLATHAKVALLVTGTLLLIGAVAYLGLEWNHAFADLAPGDKVLAAIFQSVTPRTAGFQTVDQAAFTEASKVLTMILMFIGASPASTGGGIKTTTFFLLFVILAGALKGDKNISFHKRNVSATMVRKAFAVLVFALTTVVTASLLVLIIETNGPNSEMMTVGNIFFESFSAFSTVGLTQGITPYLSTASEIIFSVVMFIGRVGPLTLGAAIAKGNHSENGVQYTDAKIMIG